MTLGTFQPRQRISGDKLPLNSYIGRPLLVRTNEYVEAFTSQAYPNPKPVVFCDVVDLISGQIFINVLWGGGAVVDNLKEFAGTETIMPVKPGQGSGQSGRTYQTLLALEGQEAQAASQWYNAYWGLVDQERAKREAASRPLQAAAPVQNAAPAQQQYAAPQGQPLPHDQQGYAAPAAQQGPPPQQFGAPLGQYTPSQNAAPAHQYGNQPGAWAPNPQNTAPQGQPAPQQHAQGGQPTAFAGQPPQGQAPAGMFTDGPPPVQPGQGFAPPAQQAPDAAQAALATLNQQLQ